MVEYARCIYTAWCKNKSPDYIQSHEQEVIELISGLLGYTCVEVLERIQNQPWYLH